MAVFSWRFLWVSPKFLLYEKKSKTFFRTKSVFQKTIIFLWRELLANVISWNRKHIISINTIYNPWRFHRSVCAWILIEFISFLMDSDKRKKGEEDWSFIISVRTAWNCFRRSPPNLCIYVLAIRHADSTLARLTGNYSWIRLGTCCSFPDPRLFK